MRYFTQSLIRRIGAALCLLSCWSLPNVLKAQTTFFSQDFSSSAAVNSYVSGTATANQFSFISSASNPNTPVSVATNGRGLTFRRLTAGAQSNATVRADRGVLVRNFNDWAGPPTALMVSFNLRVQGLGTTNSNISEGAIFAIGQDFTNDTAQEAANAHSRFALAWNSGTNGGYRVRRFESTANTDGTDRNGVTRVWWFINQTASAITYSAPNGATATLNANAWTMWVGRNDSTAVPANIHNNTAALNSAKQLRNFKMIFKHPMANGATPVETWLSLDSFRVESIVTPLSSTTGGTVTVGVNRQVPSLSGAGGAFQMLNSSTLTSACTLNVQSHIWEIGHNNVAAQTLQNNASFTATNNVLITNTSSGTQYKISSNSTSGATGLQATHLINGADFVTIDGGITNLQTESATSFTNSRLHFRNTNTGNNSRIFTVTNDSKNFTLRGCYLTHAPHGGNQDADFIRVTLGATDGNDDISFTNNFFISDPGGGRSSLLEFSTAVGLSTALNDNVLIQRNNFVNIGNANAPGQAASIVPITGIGSNFLARDNSFYLSQAITPSGNTSIFCFVPGPANGQQFISNYFGGTGPKCSGSALTANVNAAGFIRLIPFRGDLVANRDFAVTYKDNVFANMDLNEGFNNCDEQLFTNWIMTGDITFEGNEFGVLAPLKFTRTYKSDGGGARGVDMVNAATGAVRQSKMLFKNNIFKNIELNTSGSVAAPPAFQRTGMRFYAIRTGTNGGLATDNFTIEGNQIENVQVNAAGPAGFFQMYGIECANNTNGTVIVRNNTIKNMLTKSTATTLNTQGGNPCAGGFFDILSTMRGIRISTADTTRTQVYGNLVSDLRTTLATDTVVGIDHWVTPAVTIPGSSPYAGGTRENHHIYNNIVDLTTSTTGSIFGYRQRFPSSYLTTVGQVYLDYNTITVGGTTTTGGNSAAFRRELNSAPITLRNNIIQNVRSGGTGNHYAYDLNTATDFTASNNIVYSSDKTGIVGGVDANTFANWQALSAQDASGTPGSKSGKQTFDGSYNVTSCQLFADVATTISSPLAITTDYNGATRTPNSPGAVTYSAGGTPTSVTWNGSVSSDWNDVNNWCGLTVPTATISAVLNNDQTPANWPNVTSGTINCKNLIISDIANLTLGSGVTINVHGDLTKSGSGTFTNTGATINLAGSATANLSGFTADQVNVSGTGTKSLSGNVTIDKLTINSGATLAINGNTLTVTESLTNSGTLSGGATSNFTYSGSDFGTVNVNFSQINNLSMSNTGTGSILEINAPATIFGNVTVSSGTVDANGNNLAVRGNLNGSGSGTLTGGSSGTVTFDGVGTQTITGTHTFNNLAVSRVAVGTLTIASGASATASGTVNIATATATLNVQGTLSYGNLTNSGTFTVPATANLGITGTGSWPAAPVISTINDLTIASPNVTLPNNLTVNGALNLETGGVLNFSGRTLTLNGNVNANGGVLKGNSTANLALGASGTVSGDVPFGPNPADRTIGTFTGNKAFSIGSNLTISGAATFNATFAVNGNTLAINSTSTGLSNLSTGATSTLSFGTGAGAVTLPNTITTLGGLTVNTASGVSLNGNLSVGELTLTNGKLNVPIGNTLTYTGADAPTRTAGYVALLEDAVFKWDIPAGASGTLTFPVGPEAVNGVTGYRPFTLSGTVASATSVNITFRENIAANPTSATNVSGTGNKRANFTWLVTSSASISGIGIEATSAAGDFNATPVVADLALFRGQASPWERIGGTSAGYTVSTLSSTLNSGTNQILLGEGGGVDLPAGALAGLYIWTGAVSTDWNTGGNWDQGTVPNAPVHSVTIGNQVRKPVIASGAFNVNNINILTGGSITVNSGATLVISGTFTNNGSFNANQGSSVTFSGSGAQTINGTTSFHNLTVNKSVNPLTLGSSGTSVSGTLTLSGSSVFNLAGNHLTLKAISPTVNGQIANLTTPANLQNSTNVTVERKLPYSLFTNNTGGSVMVGSPVAGKTLSDYNTFNSLTLMGANGISSVWYYDPFGVAPPEPQNFGWVRPLNLGFSMNPTIGVRMFFRANPFWLQNGGTIQLNGSVNKGTISTAVSQLLYCNSGCAIGSTNGWNIVSNPYPSSINWNSPSITLTNVNPTIYIWRHDIQAYSTYNRSTLSGTNGGTNVVGAQQGFFVEAISSSSSITFNEGAKIGTNNAQLRQGAPVTPVTNRLRVQLTRNGSNWEADEALLQFHTDASRGYDTAYDSRKLDGARYNVSFLPGNGYDFVINTMNYPTAAERVAMKVNSSVAGSHKLDFTDLGMVPAGYDIFLQDNYMGVVQNLLMTPYYDFDITADPSSQGNARFEIVYAPSGVTGINNIAATRNISVFPNPSAGKANLTLALNGMAEGKATIKVVDALGRTISNSQVEVTGLHTLTPLNARLAAGVYTVICESEGNSFTTRLVVKD